MPAWEIRPVWLPPALYMYRETFGKKAERNMWLEPIH